MAENAEEGLEDKIEKITSFCFIYLLCLYFLVRVLCQIFACLRDSRAAPQPSEYLFVDLTNFWNLFRLASDLLTSDDTVAGNILLALFKFSCLLVSHATLLMILT